MAVRRKVIRRLVEDLLAKNGIENAPVPVDEIADKESVDVRYEATDDDGLSGFLLRGPAVPGELRAIIGVNKYHHVNRQRFSIAHELGHLLLHAAGEEVHVDRDTVFRVKRRDSESSKGTDPDEREANAFAAELLMPASFLLRDLEDIEVLEDSNSAVADLASRYGVSQQALMIRLANLGYRFE
ncbi:MAG TPA: ImmA/IrrE family metallo-endopeptidase [Polyangia bacterium]|nr:ImmA/IrrE family metallo-endopeptidase [Polyangia bacterium]